MRRLFGLIVLLALVAGGLWYWKQRGGAPPLPEGLGPLASLPPVEALADAKRAWAVKAAFRLHRELAPQAIQVAVADEVVTLSGRVPRPALRQLAGEVAASVPGVRRVDNRIEVQPGPEAEAPAERTLSERFDDAALALEVRLALSLDATLEGASITPSAVRGAVTLKGEVVDAAQRARAVARARAVPGVTSVQDALRVRPAGG
jgi:osmotically-inducible protein OsmY